jgi:2-amino-4-hydroxy-6-hydroxymethyldihydropteridine diphosphokinase
MSVSADDSTTPEALVSVGSNLSPREHLIEAALRLKGYVESVSTSTVWQTRAIGRPDDPDFLNCVWRLKSPLPADRLRSEVLKAVERSLGRRKGEDPWGPRTIDLDLLLRVPDDGTLDLPPPDIDRWFVQLSLIELEPDLLLPDGRRLDERVPLLQPPPGAGEPDRETTAVLRELLDHRG